jgi:putative endonuclease
MEKLDHRSAAYALSNADETWIYKGSTNDLAERIKAHLSGQVPRTKSRLPLKLVYSEYFDNYTDARRRELWLKTGQGREWLKEKIHGENLPGWRNPPSADKSVDARDFPPAADLPSAEKSSVKDSKWIS